MTAQDLAINGGQSVLAAPLPFRSVFGEECAELVSDLMASRPLSTLFGNHDVAELECTFTQYTGAQHAVAVNAGTSALHCALVALGIGPGDEVAVTSFSFIASASVILQVGARPVFIDIEPDHLTLSVESLRQRRTPLTKAVIAVHIFGFPCDMDPLQAYCEESGLFLIEDACQSLGAFHRGRHTGSMGHCGCFSFNVNKLVQCGEGGMLITDDEELAERVRQLRVNGLSQFGQDRLGFNYTLNNLSALLAKIQIPRIHEFRDKRRRHAQFLTERIRPFCTVLTDSRSECHSVDYALPILLPIAEMRETVIQALILEGVPLSGLYTILYHHDFMSPYAPAEPCRIAEASISRLISFNPSHLYEETEIRLFGQAFDKVLSRLDELSGMTVCL
ncbi:MAG: DegT/DnrJ/EryC1/StrS family aminotransferase [Candidatus Thiodiazotropha sp. (ex Dulcina madagascariensis)]|nr:DegT/DnrJ/EryC1/StrS family aminotransferase [Candidatus Thiodiazotropha sp. (ex Dulcina madagascariensis)]